MTTKPKFPCTPEIDRLRRVKERSQTVGAFLEWLNERGWILATPHRHDDGCMDEGVHRCGYQTEEYQPTYYKMESLLAEYFEIDLEKVEEERRGLLDYQQFLNENPTPTDGHQPTAKSQRKRR